MSSENTGPTQVNDAEDKEQKKKARLAARQEEMRRKAKEDAKLKAASKKQKDVSKVDDDEKNSGVTEEQTIVLNKLKELPNQGRSIDSFSFPEGITRRLSPLEHMLLLRDIKRNNGELSAAIVDNYNNENYAKQHLQEEFNKNSDLFNKKVYKKYTGTDLEARKLKVENRISKTTGTLKTQMNPKLIHKSNLVDSFESLSDPMKLGVFDIDRRDDESRDTYLHKVCAAGIPAAAKWLLSHGASANMTNSKGDTPCMVALHTIMEGGENTAGAYECLWMLLQWDVSVSQTNIEGTTLVDAGMKIEPPLEMYPMLNLIHLYIQENYNNMYDDQVTWWTDFADKWESIPTIPMGQIIKFGLKDYRLRKSREEQERKDAEEKARLEEEEAKRLLEEQEAKDKKETADLRKNGRIIWTRAVDMLRGALVSTHQNNPTWVEKVDFANIDQTLHEEFIDIINTYSFVRLLCDETITKIFQDKLVDVSAPLKFAPEFNAVAIGAVCRDQLIIGTLLGLSADPNALANGADGDMNNTVTTKITPLSIALKALNALVKEGFALETTETRNTMEVCSRLVEAGGQVAVDIKEDGTFTVKDHQVAMKEAIAFSTQESVKTWIELQFKASDPKLYDDRKRKRVLAAMLVLVSTYEEQEQQNIQAAKARMEEKRRRKVELAKRQEELTAKLLEASNQGKDRVNDDLEVLAKQLEEQEEKLRQEALEADALMAAKLKRGKKDQDDMYEKAMNLVAMQYAQNESADAAAAKALEEKMKKKKKTKDEKEEIERLRAEGEELQRQQRIEEEELRESMEPVGFFDAQFYSTFTTLDVDHLPSDEELTALHPELSRFTIRSMDTAIYDQKFFKMSYKGLHTNILETLDAEVDYNHKTGANAWDAATRLCSQLDGNTAERKILQKFLTQTDNFSKKALREIHRRIQILSVNTLIYEDILRRLQTLWSKEMEAQAPPAEFKQLMFRIEDMVEAREKKEIEEMTKVFSLPLNSIRKGGLSKDLCDFAKPHLATIEVAFNNVHPDDQQSLPIDFNLTDRLESDTPSWEAAGYLERQLANTDALIRDLRKDKTQCQEQLTSPDILPEAKKEVEEMIQRLNDQIAPLDVQHAMYLEQLGVLNDYERKAYAKLSPDDQLLWNKCHAKHKDALRESIAAQEAIRQSNIASASVPNKASALIDKIKAVFKDDWNVKDKDKGKDYKVNDEKLEAFDDQLDDNWLESKFDLTGIDKDIIDDLRVLNAPQALRYLALQMAENEGNAAFLRKCQKLTNGQLNDAERAKVTDYQHFLDTRFPMFQHLYGTISGFTEEIDHGMPSRMVPFDGVTPATKVKFHHKDEKLNDLMAERETNKAIQFSLDMHQATMQPLDWSGFREELASDRYLNVMTNLCSGIMGGGVSGVSGGIAGRLYDDLASPLYLPSRSTQEQTHLTIVQELHKQLHGLCDVSEDVVEMIVNTMGDGQVDKKNLVKVLHAIHIACHRDTSVFWDSKIMMPMSTYGGAGTSSHWGLFNTPQDMLLTSDQGRMVFAFNDFDVTGGEYYGRFLAALTQKVHKSLRTSSSLFPVEVYSMKHVHKYLSSESKTDDYSHNIHFPYKYGTARNEEEMADPKDSTMSVLPIDGYGVYRDNYLDASTYGTNVASGVERSLRLPVPYYELRSHLVTTPDLNRYMPTNWRY